MITVYIVWCNVCIYLISLVFYGLELKSISNTSFNDDNHDKQSKYIELEHSKWNNTETIDAKTKGNDVDIMNNRIKTFVG